MARRSSKQVDEEMQADLTDSVGELRELYINRLNAGLPLTLEEWEKLGDSGREVWEHCLTEYRLKNHALQAHYLADSMRGGTLAIETVWDILPEEVQERFQRHWSKQNAEQNRTDNERANRKSASRDASKRQ